MEDWGMLFSNKCTLNSHFWLFIWRQYFENGFCVIVFQKLLG